MMKQQDGNSVQVQLAPFVEAIGRWMQACSEEPTRNDFSPAPGSIAAGEIAEEDRWATPGWEEPARNAHSYGQLFCSWMFDHLSALAAAAGNSALGPSYAHLTLLRSLLEGASTATWLMDPTANTESRIKRSYAYRLDNTENLGRHKRTAEAVESAESTRASVDLALATLGWVANTNKARPSVEGEQMPDPKTLIGPAVFGVAADTPIGEVLWNYTSAVAHGTFYGLRQPLEEVADVGQRGQVRAIKTSAATLAYYLTIAALATKAVVNARRDLMGWSASRDLRAIEDELAAICSAAYVAGTSRSS